MSAGSDPLIETPVNGGILPNSAVTEPTWRGKFKVPTSMDKNEVKFLIDSFLPVGTGFVAGLSGHGKTWFALSIAKSLFHGTKFLDYFTVPKPVPIIYLIPESGEASFRSRLDKMGLGSVSDGFFCLTLNDGPPIELNDPNLLAAVSDLKPAVFLDTAIRFSSADNENDARQNDRGLAAGFFRLQQAGAQAVIGVHHSPKIFSKVKGVPKLEQTLRGSGDLGAMVDFVYALQCRETDSLKIEVTCVKNREDEFLAPFTIQGRPFINETGDFKLIVEPKKSPAQSETECLVAALRLNPTASYREVERATGIKKDRIKPLADRAGWEKRGDRWLCLRA